MEKNKFINGLFILVAILSIASIAMPFFVRPEVKIDASAFRNLSGVDDGIPLFTQQVQFWIGKGYATKVASINRNRVYLELGNFSGATSTAQAIFCVQSALTDATTTNLFVFPFNTTTSYQGFAIQASSSRVFNRATGMITGSVYCVNPSASSTISVLEY